MATTPPSTAREVHTELLHGHRVEDPYRWLEAPAGDDRVRAFIDEQDTVARAHLASLPERAGFADRLRQVWDHPRRSVPWHRGPHWFQFRNDGLQDQDVLWHAVAREQAPQQLPPEPAWSVLQDPNTWSASGTVALSGLAISPDGSRAAVGRAEAGSDWRTWLVVDVTSGQLLDDAVPWSKFGGAAWLPDASGFLYTAYDPPEVGHEHAAANRNQRVMLHRVGTPATADLLVYARPDQPEWGFEPRVSHDGRWLVLTSSRGTDPETGVHVAGLSADGTPGEVRTLLEAGRALHHPIGVVGTRLLVVSDQGAPLGRVLAIPLDGDPGEVLVEESGDRLLDARILGAAQPGEPGWLICHRLHHATSRLEVFDPEAGTAMGTIGLPWPVTVTGQGGGREDRELYLDVGSFTAPDRLLRCDPASGVTEPLWAPPGSEAQDELVVEQVQVHHDGVAVPLFLIHRGDVAADGARPTVLWGYGGFDVAVTPMHRPDWHAWVAAGGVLAVACLRGGGEYGRPWHDDGRRQHKEHVFDDALACAAWLTGRRRDEVTATALSPAADAAAIWSEPSRLGIEGRSNGGLLAAACLVREPDAFGSAVPEVGVLDLVRFHRFTIGWAWTSDYGSPDDPDDLAVLLRYSPYHNLRPGTAYPATLLTTGDTDDRVVPAHSFKFAAALQHAQGGPAPVLLRIDRAAGHGSGKPVTMLLEERADVLAFHATHLGLTTSTVTPPP